VGQRPVVAGWPWWHLRGRRREEKRWEERWTPPVSLEAHAEPAMPARNRPPTPYAQGMCGGRLSNPIGTIFHPSPVHPLPCSLAPPPHTHSAGHWGTPGDQVSGEPRESGWAGGWAVGHACACLHALQLPARWSTLPAPLHPVGPSTRAVGPRTPWPVGGTQRWLTLLPPSSCSLSPHTHSWPLGHPR